MTTPLIPIFIPSQVCATVGQDPATPPDQCMNLVRADVLDDGVSAPPSTDSGALAQVVADAKQKGIDLKIVVLNQDPNPAIETPLRDIATEIGHAYPGSTVLVLSPWFAGTYSDVYDRVTLEAGQDLAKTGDPVQSSKNFVSQLSTPDFPWTALTIVLVLVVAAAVVLTRVLRLRSKDAVGSETTADAAD